MFCTIFETVSVQTSLNELHSVRVARQATLLIHVAVLCEMQNCVACREGWPFILRVYSPV